MSSDESGAVRMADGISEVLYTIAGVTLLGLGGFFAVSSLASLADGPFASVLGLGLAFVLLAFGVFLTPAVRRRLARRHGLGQFGTVRSVDHRAFDRSDGSPERCVHCDEPTDRGLIRRYRDEYAVAGIPVYTRDIGYNHYCPDCARSGPLSTGFTGGRTDQLASQPPVSDTQTASDPDAPRTDDELEHADRNDPERSTEEIGQR
ncbi:hypothetical protein C479_13458 [Halovivax asiaticus JCM 14624]|uniref:DUF8108 domain-containing protein n=1 Tax=Halovivax asiaticus JCM 14624 TaxID=1227490 RepID=M0BFA8_9EURY|nr:hypothetical protein [Halovivax asiaticus]ELZ08349.1 hypothetical protein C479_13458 [Halovivax asiaticus JCM 14624]